MVSKLPSSFILICTTEIRYLTVSFPLLARLSDWDFFEPSKTILLGYKSKSPWAFDIVEDKMDIPKTTKKKYFERFLPGRDSVKAGFCTIGFFNLSIKRRF